MSRSSCAGRAGRCFAVWASIREVMSGPVSAALASNTRTSVSTRRGTTHARSNGTSPPAPTGLTFENRRQTDGWQQPLTTLAMRHEVIALWVADPREREIPDIGVVTFEDPESGGQLVVDTGNARLRARFQQAAAEQREAIRSHLRHCRVAIGE